MTDGGSGAGSTFQDWMNETSHGGHLHVECHRQAWDAGHRSGRADLEAARSIIARLAALGQDDGSTAADNAWREAFTDAEAWLHEH